jgi:hypothetical protein
MISSHEIVVRGRHIPYTVRTVREADDRHVAEVALEFDLPPAELAVLQQQWKAQWEATHCEVCSGSEAFECDGHILCSRHAMRMFKALM